MAELLKDREDEIATYYESADDGMDEPEMAKGGVDEIDYADDEDDEDEDEDEDEEASGATAAHKAKLEELRARARKDEI